MKTSNRKLMMLILGGAVVVGGFFSSCSKSSSNGGGGGTPPPKAPTNPGGYDSANEIQASALVAYFPFNGSYNDVKQGLTATNTNGTFATGVKGQGFKGNGSSFLVVPFGSAASMFAGTSLKSFTVSMWVDEPQAPLYVPASAPQVYTPGEGPEGLLFMYDGSGHQDLFHMDIEPYANDSVSEDTMNLNAGFTITGATTTGPYAGSTVGGTEGVVPNAHLDTAINKWVQIVMTYDGASSNYTLYENGTAVGVNSAWSTFANISPIQVLTGGLTSGFGSAPTAGSVPLGPLNFTPAPVGLVIGAWSGTAGVGGFTANQYSGSFKGTMDELRIYNSALTASDVKSLYILEHAGF
jgi:hypothetical protein